MMEYAVIPANVVTSRKSAVSHSWMLIRGRPRPRPDRNRPSEGPTGRGKRGPPPPEDFSACTSPLRFGRKSRFLPENIPDTPGGVDKLGVPGVAFDLLAEVAYMHVDRALVAELVAPHTRQERAPREHPARVGGQRYQKLELRVR